ncbi:1A family penicillin-binding protein [Perkinsela sp. CCAP 1560/4]|nr:hypothetical protein XU18_4115 [Perkinsela sp. CCAP 1560/4]KNH06708.1 1A family penicillin-binding protein [Perkinsela sp. CCAP 1560/4]|eukprot:KNH04703.1 hypothetical protein XU18_4115 [Perkinsela sp. CCAP 1560/4]
MKRNILVCGTSWKSHWTDGENGFDWKNRYLEEQRSRALDFLFDVSKRKPIHDSIREYHQKTWGESTPVEGLHDKLSEYDPDLREQKRRAGVLGKFYTATALEKDENSNLLPEPDVEDIFSTFMRGQAAHDQFRKAESTDNSMPRPESDCGAEDVADTLAHLSKEDLDLIADEFYPKTTVSRTIENDLMKDVLRCRKSMSPKYSYAKIPQQERTTWSPWYLRHLTKREKDT